MRWEGRRRSGNVEDVGGSGRGKGVVLGGGLGTLALVVVVMLLGGDPSAILDMAGSGGGGPPAGQVAPVDSKKKEFVELVLASTEDVWDAEFQAMGRRYEHPQLKLFTGGVESGCGFASSQVGPFYCPADRTIYLDVAFFDELDRKFGAPGDFAQAYVIAHEVGHHVQNLLGISDQLNQARGRVSETEYNELSVRLELQADFLAGLWAKKGQGKGGYQLEMGDLEEGLSAANAIGDDTLQKQARGHVVPDSFTHGSSAQRIRWFKKGYDSADIRQGDTFRTNDL